MNTLKHYYLLGLLTLVFSLVFSSCQGPLDDDISSLFDTFPANAYVSGTTTPSSGESSSSGQNLDNIYGKLIGKWILTKYTFIGEGSDTYDEDDDYYIEFYSDFTAYINPWDLFEANKSHCSWKLIGTSKIVFNNDEDDTYSIMQLSSSSLVLGWLDGGKVVEITTFKKAN